VTVETVGVPPELPETVTVAVPYLVVSAVDVAVTVRLEAVSPAATVRRPVVLMEVPEPPPGTAQVTD
jgi:hypothetical protein